MDSRKETLRIENIDDLITPFNDYCDSAPPSERKRDVILTLIRKKSEEIGLVPPVNLAEILSEIISEVESNSPKTLYNYWIQLQARINERFRLKKTNLDLSFAKAVCAELLQQLFNTFDNSEQLQECLQYLNNVLSMDEEFKYQAYTQSIDPYIDWEKIKAFDFVSRLSMFPKICFNSMCYKIDEKYEDRPSYGVNISLLKNLGISLGNVFLTDTTKALFKLNCNHSELPLPVELFKKIANDLSGFELHYFGQVSKICYNLVEQADSTSKTKYKQFYTNVHFWSKELRINKTTKDEIMYFDGNYLLTLHDYFNIHVFSMNENYSEAKFCVAQGAKMYGCFIDYQKDITNIYFIVAYAINREKKKYDFFILRTSFRLFKELQLDGREKETSYLKFKLKGEMNPADYKIKALIDLKGDRLNTNLYFYEKDANHPPSGVDTDPLNTHLNLDKKGKPPFNFFGSQPVKHHEMTHDVCAFSIG